MQFVMQSMETSANVIYASVTFVQTFLQTILIESTHNAMQRDSKVYHNIRVKQHEQAFCKLAVLFIAYLVSYCYGK